MENTTQPTLAQALDDLQRAMNKKSPRGNQVYRIRSWLPRSEVEKEAFILGETQVKRFTKIMSPLDILKEGME